MKTKTRGLRVPYSLEQSISEVAEATGRSWSAVTTDLLEEAIRQRRAPGVIFVDGASRRRAVVAGSGIDVWEIVAAWKVLEGDFAELRREFDWLTEPQLRAALGYYELYPDEIEERLSREEEWTPERVRTELPFSSPRKS